VPTNLSQSSVSAYSATLNWSPVTGVDSLQLRIYDPVYQTVYITGSFSGTFSQISIGVGPNHKYRWKVRPKCAGIWTPWDQCGFSVFTTPPFRLADPAANMPLTALYKIDNDGLDNESEVERTLIISPNPASNKTTVVYSGNHEGTIQLQLIDFTGKVMYSENKNLVAGNNYYEIDLHYLAKGIYMVIIYDNGKRISNRIVVN
jgi:hypothetical protein